MSRFFLAIFLLAVCQVFSQPDKEKNLQTQFILAQNGSIISLEEGNMSLSKSLSMDGKKNITIKGAGVDKTILSFKGQTSGAEGIKISNCENIVLEDLTVQDSKGDLIKTLHVKGITFRRVKAEWTGTPNEKNGGYALYPVQCERVMIDSCIAIGASDAGIYVGQSKYILVKNSTAYHNVAGIEIENSLYAEVYNNKATANTGGILVFDLPNLVQKKGGHVKVHHNQIVENNFPNFAPKGNIVAKVPKGTGMLVLATSHVEVYENELSNNATMSVGIISYFMTENKIKDKDYNPYPSDISIHHNRFERLHKRVPMAGRFGQIYRFKLKFGKNVPHILYDGIIDKNRAEASANTTNPMNICIYGNNQESFANIDAWNDFKNISRDLSPYQCVNKK